MDSHSFCRELLRSALENLDAIQPGFRPSTLSITKNTLGGYTVEGPPRPNRFYHYANSACCVWSAKAEAIDKIIDALKESGEYD